MDTHPNKTRNEEEAERQAEYALHQKAAREKCLARLLELTGSAINFDQARYGFGTKQEDDTFNNRAFYPPYEVVFIGKDGVVLRECDCALDTDKPYASTETEERYISFTDRIWFRKHEVKPTVSATDIVDSLLSEHGHKIKDGKMAHGVSLNDKTVEMLVLYKEQESSTDA